MRVSFLSPGHLAKSVSKLAASPVLSPVLPVHTCNAFHLPQGFQNLVVLRVQLRDHHFHEPFSDFHSQK